MENKISLSYKSAGVNIDAGNLLAERIKKLMRYYNQRSEIIYLDGFSALCTIPKKYSEPVIVLGTDGVGTKLCLAIKLKSYKTIGIDLVAMCVNDLVAHGAEPLFFLDYYATGKLDVDKATNIINGIFDGCLQSGCALIGGETAEMPGIYHGEDCDIAGFCIGVVEKSKIINSNKVNDEDVLIALGSNGLHSNGYSLVRKIIKLSEYDLETTKLEGKSIADHLLVPTHIYVKSVLALIKHVEIHAIAHITGGGFWENIPRILPDSARAEIDESSWRWPIIFNWLQKAGNISRYEMYHTFNCGVGMIIALPEYEANTALKLLQDSGENAWVIGVIKKSNYAKCVVIK